MPKDTILDDWFPRSPVFESTRHIQNVDERIQKRTIWNDAPEHIRSLLDTWSEVSGLKFHSDRKYQVKCACNWYKEFGSDPQLVRDAFRKQQDARLLYKSLDSLRSMARTIVGNKVEPDSREERDKYLKWSE